MDFFQLFVSYRNVINSLSSGKVTHVPFRNSTLTRLLQECLGSKCLTSFIVSTLSLIHLIFISQQNRISLKRTQLVKKISVRLTEKYPLYKESFFIHLKLAYRKKYAYRQRTVICKDSSCQFYFPIIWSTSASALLIPRNSFSKSRMVGYLQSKVIAKDDLGNSNRHGTLKRKSDFEIFFSLKRFKRGCEKCLTYRAAQVLETTV